MWSPLHMQCCCSLVLGCCSQLVPGVCVNRCLLQHCAQVKSAADIASADKLIFPGVGAFGAAMESLEQQGYTQALKEYIKADRPFFGICLGMQLLFDGSEENGGCEGLGLIPGQVTHFDKSKGLPVPHIGWNDLIQK